MRNLLKNFLFENVPQEQAASAAPTTTTPDAAAPAMFVPGNDNLYQQLVAATQFEKTKVGQIIDKYLSSFATLPMPAEMKFKSAAKVAETQDGVLPAAVIGAYDEMKDVLTREQTNFEHEAAEFERVEITERQERMKTISTDIEAAQKALTEAQQRLANESSALAQAQGTSAQMKTQFTMALQRRTAEIEQEKIKISAIVNG